MSQWKNLCALEDIPLLGSRVVQHPGGDIAVFRTDGDAVFALHDKCPHKGGPLSQGIVHGQRVTCPLHSWNIELASGEGDTARIKPHTEFRDGFNIAGDEVLREVVANHVIPAIGQALAREGLAEPRSLLGQLFGRDSIGMSQEDRNTRVRLVRQIAVPVALGLLATCENPDLRGASFSCSLGDFFEPDPVADAAAAEGSPAQTMEAAGPPGQD